MILSTRNTSIPEETEAAEASGGANDIVDQSSMQMRHDSDDASTLQDPESIKNKGRPVKPKRWKDMIEQEREKIKAAKKKNPKKAKTTSKKNKEENKNLCSKINIAKN